jgi:uncharacterized membrane-anchored protein
MIKFVSPLLRARRFNRFILAAACVAFASSRAQAAGGQDPQLEAKKQQAIALLKSIEWQNGPGTGKLGNIAEVKIPAGYRFTGQAGAAKWAELNENIPSSSELGVLMPKDHPGWFIVFSYEDSGHVADDEKGSLDAAAILQSLRDNNEMGNEERKRRGWPTMELAGWQAEPAYDPVTHHLVWALRIRSEGEDTINYNTRMLGRTGVMSANLVVEPEKLQSAIAPGKQLLADYKFNDGSKYSEFRAGDKVAQYGLTGLITGGLVVAAAKSGLLAKLGIILAKFAKVIIIGIAALGAAFAKFFRAIFGGSKARS